MTPSGPSEAPPPTSRPNVIYVMGAGHSGSSILGVALGNCRGFFYAGEVEEWLTKGGAARWGGSDRTRFWSAVRDEMDTPPARLQGGAANRFVERSSSALRLDRWPARRRMISDYRRVAEDLFRAIAGASGARNIVDTSHFPLRARELRTLQGIELYLVFLVRDPQSVVASNVRELSPHEVAERRFRILTTNAGLWLTQLLSVIVFLRHPRQRRLFVRHEAFVGDPGGVLRQLLDMTGSPAPIPDLSELDTGMPLEGNWLLRSTTIALDGSVSQRPRWSRLTALLQLPWELVYPLLGPSASAITRRRLPRRDAASSRSYSAPHVCDTPSDSAAVRESEDPERASMREHQQP